jgi:S-adenosylmethionine-diacylgycerolhomoserine-N-methlytransferase
MPDDPRVAMDRMYRYQRHVYDLTRKFYLLGRDQLLASLPLQPGDRVCEIGCGTARNLIALGLRHPEISLYGVDASATMLATARSAVTRAGLAERIRLQSGLAEGPGWHGSFGLDTLFDIELFSYSLSMMPNWEAALDTANNEPPTRRHYRHRRFLGSARLAHMVRARTASLAAFVRRSSAD